MHPSAPFRCARRLAVVGVAAALAILPVPIAQASAAAAAGPTTSAPAAVATAATTAARKATPSLAVAASSTDAAHRSTIAITVKGARVTGTVRVTRSGTSYGTRNLVNGKASLRLPRLAVGQYSFRATYSGDATHASTSATVRVRVTRAKPGLTLSARPVDLVHKPTIRATVTGGAGTATGSVKVVWAGKSYGAGTLARGRASVPLRTFAIGRHTFRVIYSGNAQYAPRAALVSVTVTRARPALSVPTRSVQRGNRATISVTVKGDAGTPAGRVRVSRSGKMYGTRTLVRGKASVELPLLGVGSYTFTISYLGSSRYARASAAVKVSVTRGAHHFADGMFRVGVDIVPGLYRAKVPAGELCYWERLRNASGAFSAIIANQVATGYALIQVASTDRFVTSDDCGTFRLVSETTAWRFGGTIPGNGMFVVGKDIRPGRYHQSAKGCYWERDRSASGQFSAIIANDFTSGASYVTIARSDKVFVTSGCSRFTRVG